MQGLGTAFQSRKSAALASVLYRVGLRKANTVFFENAGNVSEFVKRGIIPEGKITLLSGAGVNLERFPLMPYPSENGGVRFLYVGRIMREKGMDELSLAMRRLKKEFGERVQFDIVGFFEDDYRQTVEDLAHDGVIHFYGFQENTAPFYAAAHCVVLPSWHEGMSNVLLEGAATGRALITSDMPGCREAVTEGETGFLSKVKDAESLYQVMKAFLLLEPEERTSMGRRGREKMEREFDRSDVLAKTLVALKI